MPLSLSSNSLQFFLFFFYPTLPFDITHFTFLGDKPVDSIIHPSAKSAHLYIHNLTQVSSHAVENIHHTDSTTRPCTLTTHIEWQSARRMMQNAQSCHTAESSIRQMHQYGRSKPYTAESSNTAEKSMPYTK